ncbi:MAG: hypothetical protein WDN06_14350 [Asticcacaulis sp.]
MPYVAAHDGWTVFVDCDVLFTRDINEVFEGLDPSKALYCVHHDYTPANVVKMDGKEQTVYPRKNWSSFMIFNGSHPDVKTLTPEAINTVAPAWLHRFEWTTDEAIGELSRDWNFLEGEYAVPEKLPANIHFTNGDRGSTAGRTSISPTCGAPSATPTWQASRSQKWRDME